ncbi:thiamine-phosphate kinase [Candidatus Igneacidithiobacillus taiwanensis]|uniref:thiamine-phosphate kinase n=1 Tax=Candidatus Igneacidithiobacillus taiwanensis TaxID=1945924 RepID=UPI0028A08409|nr:thiamine-phosphate kinase [Candidatus Igneacidithiobacillus taiwanensis]
MATGEFALIDELRRGLGQVEDDAAVIVGIGDDAAVLDCGGRRLVACTDTLVAGRHFFAELGADDLAWKALAVNLSDLAAMGAEPRWALLNLALPAGMATPAWRADFMRGWQELALPFNLRLVGGDTVACDGPLTVTVTALGLLAGDALLRSGAQVGDDLYVTGTLGDVALALELAFAERAGEAVEDLPGAATLEQCRRRPTPRVAFGQAAQRLGARCAQDVSDGFLADLHHILQASGVGARIDGDAIPLSPVLAGWVGDDWQRLLRTALTGGDDYELILAAPPALAVQLQTAAQQTQTPLQRVGSVLPAAAGLQLFWQGRRQDLPEHLGHQHVI